MWPSTNKSKLSCQFIYRAICWLPCLQVLGKFGFNLQLLGSLCSNWTTPSRTSRSCRTLRVRDRSSDLWLHRRMEYIQFERWLSYWASWLPSMSLVQLTKDPQNRPIVLRVPSKPHIIYKIVDKIFVWQKLQFI